MGLKRQLLLSTAIGLVVANPHPSAAQSPRRTALLPDLPQTYSWTGFYIGGTIGQGWSNNATGCSFVGAAADSPCIPAGPPNVKQNGILGGVEAGYNWQAGNWLLGIESDFSALDVSDVAHFPAADTAYAPAQISSRYDWLGTLRGRAGFAVDRTLLYATGGLAYARINQAYSDSGNVLQSSGQKNGWTAGGGVEYALTKNWSVKAEYLYVKLSDSSFVVPESAIAGDITALQLKNNLNIIRGGLDYRF
jgi:outer membrane immunogenic protein